MHTNGWAETYIPYGFEEDSWELNKHHLRILWEFLYNEDWTGARLKFIIPTWAPLHKDYIGFTYGYAQYIC